MIITTFTSLHSSILKYIYIYIYRERERERELQSKEVVPIYNVDTRYFKFLGCPLLFFYLSGFHTF